MCCSLTPTIVEPKKKPPTIDCCINKLPKLACTMHVTYWTQVKYNLNFEIYVSILEHGGQMYELRETSGDIYKKYKCEEWL